MHRIGRSDHCEAESQAGFSLAEILVVLGLIALISLLASDGLRFAGRVERTTSETLTTIQEEVAAQRTLRLLIGNAVVPLQAAVPMTVSWRSKSLNFVSDLRGSAGLWGTKRISIDIVKAPAGSKISIQVRRLGGGGSSASETLGPFATDLGFSFGSIARDGIITWTESWERPGTVPDLVRLTGVQPGDAWQEFYAMTFANEPRGCRFDHVSRGCR